MGIQYLIKVNDNCPKVSQKTLAATGSNLTMNYIFCAGTYSTGLRMAGAWPLEGITPGGLVV